jgi:hypothetical protein
MVCRRLIAVFFVAALSLLGLTAEAAAACSGQFLAGQICGNGSGAQALPDTWSLNALIDRNFGAPSAQGTILNRGASFWASTINPVIGNPGSTTGTLGFGNPGGGTTTFSPPSSASSFTVTLPALSGILALNPFTATSAPASASGNTDVLGTLASAPTLSNTGQALLYNSTAGGAVLQGDGSASDILLANKSGSTICSVATGATTLACAGGTFTTPLNLASGGTNAGLVANNGGIIWSTGSALAVLSGTATANLPLLSGATATPSWATVSHPTSATSGGIPYFSSSTVMATSAQLNANALIVGGGAGGSPASIANGTNDQLTQGNTGANPGWVSVNNCSGAALAYSTGTHTFGCAAVQAQGRITFQTGTPVMLTSQTTVGTVYYDCWHGGNLVSVFNGTSDILLAIGGCEISTVLQTSGTGVLNANGVFDLWAVNVAGTLTVCVATNGSGGGWASDTGGSNTARGTGYSQLDTTTRQYPTNKNSIANCYNAATQEGTISANQATYLGTICTDAAAAGKVSWTFGTVAGVAGRFCLWNLNNRRPVSSTSATSTTSWTYASSTLRQPNASAAWQTTFAVGIAEDSFSAQFNIAESPSGSFSCGIAIGLNSTSSQSGNGAVPGTSASGTMTAVWAGNTGVGQQFLTGLESANGTSCTFNNVVSPNGQGVFIYQGLQ